MFISQQLLNDTYHTGSFLIFVIIMVATITTASAQVMSVTSIILYDIYQTYWVPFHKEKDERVMQINTDRDLYLAYNERCMILIYAIVIALSVLLVPIGLILQAIDIDIWWMFMVTGILVNPCVVPVCLSVGWHRTTGVGVCYGAVGGLICGVVSWLVYASAEFDGGFKQFRRSTGESLPLLVGLAMSLGGGGFICLVVSLFSGGCNSELEEQEWKKTQCVDSPIYPWSVKYARDIGHHYIDKGNPQFATILHAFRHSKLKAYLFGIMLTAGAILVWPGVMYVKGEFDLDTFTTWTWMVLILGIVVIAFLVVIPPIWEFVQTCTQAYHFRNWTYHSKISVILGNRLPCKI